MTTTTETERRGRAPGNSARAQIVLEAAQLASSLGLEGLSIGGLADHLGMAKSSLYTLFGSKEALQLATVESARDTFTTIVVMPAFADGRSGKALLTALIKNYLDHVRDRVFPGGCFFSSGAAEFASRPGPVHDLIAKSQAEWQQIIGHSVKQTIDAGELPASTDPAQLGFEISALLSNGALYSVLHSDNSYCDRAQKAIDALLER